MGYFIVYQGQNRYVGNPVDRGSWSSGTTYQLFDLVAHGSSRWIAVATSIGSAPASSNANWSIAVYFGETPTPEAPSSGSSLIETVLPLELEGAVPLVSDDNFETASVLKVTVSQTEPARQPSITYYNRGSYIRPPGWNSGSEDVYYIAFAKRGTSGNTEPTIAGTGTFLDGDIVWERTWWDRNNYEVVDWAPSTQFNSGQIMIVGGWVFQIWNTGTTGEIEPDWETVGIGENLLDGSLNLYKDSRFFDWEAETVYNYDVNVAEDETAFPTVRTSDGAYLEMVRINRISIQSGTETSLTFTDSYVVDGDDMFWSQSSGVIPVVIYDFDDHRDGRTFKVINNGPTAQGDPQQNIMFVGPRFSTVLQLSTLGPSDAAQFMWDDATEQWLYTGGNLNFD